MQYCLAIYAITKHTAPLVEIHQETGAHDMLSRLRKKPIQTGPAYARKPYTGSEQLAFYQRLRLALPNCTIFPDIALNDLIKPLAGDARLLRQQQDKLAGRRLTYAVFNDMLELLCVIELISYVVQHDERVQMLAMLEECGIPRFSWEHDNLPSSEQIVRVMAAYTTIAPSRFAPAANSVLQHESVTPKNVVSKKGPASFSLTVDDAHRLTPNGHIRATYPHIWERICHFCNEPRHLEHYLNSLSLQDRGSKRTGFPESVMVELTDVLGANARFIPAQRVRGGWNDSFIHR